MIRPFNPIPALKEEHREIIRELELIEKDLRKLGLIAGANGHRHNVRNAIAYVAEKVELHAEEEDEALFPLLQRFPDLARAWPVVVEQDRDLHAAFRQLLLQWSETEQRHGLGQGIPETEVYFLVQSSLRLTSTLREHMRWEEENVFAFADRNLSDEEKAEVASRMLTVRHRPRPIASLAYRAGMHQPFTA